MAKKWILIPVEDDGPGCLGTIIAVLILGALIVYGVAFIFAIVSAIVKAIVAFIVSIAVYLLCGFGMVVSVVLVFGLLKPVLVDSMGEEKATYF